jgi:hypothetical protein
VHCWASHRHDGNPTIDRPQSRFRTLLDQSVRRICADMRDYL